MSGDQQENQGQVIFIRKSVIDARFPRKLPKINHLIESVQGRGIIAELLIHLDEETVRCIALTPTAGPALGDRAATAAGIFGCRWPKNCWEGCSTSSAAPSTARRKASRGVLHFIAREE